MLIKILGTGCAKCKKLETNARKAAESLDAEVQKVTGLDEFINYGVMLTPALVVDDRFVSVEKVLAPEKIRNYITKQGKDETGKY